MLCHPSRGLTLIFLPTVFCERGECQSVKTQMWLQLIILLKGINCCSDRESWLCHPSRGLTLCLIGCHAGSDSSGSAASVTIFPGKGTYCLLTSAL